MAEVHRRKKVGQRDSGTKEKLLHEAKGKKGLTVVGNIGIDRQ